MDSTPLRDRDILKSLIEKHRGQFYQSLPYFVENHSSYKLIPYVYSIELNEAFDASFKSLKETVQKYCVPYEEKEKSFDYWIAVTPFSGIRADFIRKVCQSDNLLDKRCLERWLNGKGKDFIAAVRDVFINISRQHDDPESFCFFFLLTLIPRFNVLRQELSRADIGKLSPERKDAFFATFFFYLTELVILDYAEETNNREFTGQQFIELLSPLVFAGVKTSFFRNAYNYWGLGTDFWTSLEHEDAYNRFADGGIIPQSISRNELIVEQGAKDCLRNRVRSEMFTFIAENFGKDEMPQRLPQYLYHRTHFNSFLSQKATRQDVFKLKKDSLFRTAREEAARYEDFTAAVERTVSDLGDIDSYPACFEISFHNYLLFKAQEQFAAYVKSVISGFRDKRGDKNLDIRKEYEEGKLYYFSREEKKLINQQQVRETAALCMEIHDFALKVFNLKEEAMLELVNERFYTPVFRYGGSRKEAKLQLAYMLGDTVLFTGGVEELVRMAAATRKEIDDYRHTLEHRDIDDQKKQQMSLDLGIFIAYGTVPARAAVTSDFGNQTLCVGEIITMSRRGAHQDRNAARMLEYIRATASREQGLTLLNPFQVNVLDGHSIAVPVDMRYGESYEEHKAVRVREMESFFDSLKVEMISKYLQDEDLWPKESYLSNTGIALTQDALAVFLRIEKVYSEIKNVRISVERIPDEVRKRYFFRHREIELYLVRNSEKREQFLFRKEGSINLTGTGRDSVVWELITSEAELYKPLLSLIP